MPPKPPRHQRSPDRAFAALTDPDALAAVRWWFGYRIRPNAERSYRRGTTVSTRGAVTMRSISPIRGCPGSTP